MHLAYVKKYLTPASAHMPCVHTRWPLNYVSRMLSKASSREKGLEAARTFLRIYCARLPEGYGRILVSSITDALSLDPADFDFDLSLSLSLVCVSIYRRTPGPREHI